MRSVCPLVPAFPSLRVLLVSIVFGGALCVEEGGSPLTVRPSVSQPAYNGRFPHPAC